MDILEVRVFEGRNVWNHNPVIEARLALSAAEQVTTASLPDFTRRLVELLPGLREHSCGRGYPGGFCERLNEGTYLAHVVEHTALELQAAAGYPVGYGKTVRVEGFHIWQLAFEYGTPELGMAALRVAVGIVTNLLNGETPPVSERIDYLSRIGEATLPGPSTASIIEACRQRGIPVLPVAGGALYQLGYGCHRKLIEATVTSQTSTVAVDSAGDKLLTKQILSEHNLPVPRGIVATGWDEAREAALQLGFPVAVKPCHGNQGKGVSLGLANWRELEAAFRIAAGYDRQVLVEEYRQGRHYRLLVIAGQMVAAAERLPATVTGDGEHTINELIELANRDPRRGEGHSRALTKLKLDPVGLLDLGRQGLSPMSRPPKGKEVVVRRNANLSTGGSAADVTDLVHPEQSRLAEEAALLLGLDVAGVDLVSTDISQAPAASSTSVIEVNAAPGFRMHLAPERGKPRPVGRALVDYLFPPGGESSIPVVAVTGTNGKTTTTRMLGHLFKQCGVKVGMTTTGGIYINGRCVLTGDTTGPASARMVLRHPEVEMAILETARGGILRGGLGYDLANVAVVTNIGPDHLGQDGIETIEDLCWVKSLVVEAVQDNGYVVLNADDPYSAHFASRARGEVIYFSLGGDSKVLLRHLGAGGCAVYVSDGSVYIARGERLLRVIRVKSIRSAMGGRARHNLENALAAAAAAYACGLSPALIRKGLRTFGTQSEDNPGRLMLRRVGRVNVIVDYGHNAPAFQRIIEFARTLNPKRLVGVIGVPGDRRDDQIIAGGEVAGRGFDYIYIKEDGDLRGRAPGETAQLLYTGVRRAGLAANAVEVIPDETSAVAQALEQSRPGDLIVVFYENLEPVRRVLEEAEREEQVAVKSAAER